MNLKDVDLLLEKEITQFFLCMFLD